MLQWQLQDQSLFRHLPLIWVSKCELCLWKLTLKFCVLAPSTLGADVPVNLMSSSKCCSAQLSPGFGWSTLHPGCFLTPPRFCCASCTHPARGLQRSLRCTAEGAGGHRTSPAPLGIPPAGQFLLCKWVQALPGQHGSPCSPACCHSAGAQHRCNVNGTWESCLNKQGAYFAINMQKASFNMPQLKQQHCQDPFLQPHPQPLS